MDERYRLIDVSACDTGNGRLAMFQPGANGNIPFAIKKVLVISGMKPTDMRGQHAHHATREVIVPVSGGCSIDLDDGRRTYTVRLSAGGQALFLPAQYWRTLHSFQENTALVIIADQEYDERDYIRDYQDFLGVLTGSSPASGQAPNP